MSKPGIDLSRRRMLGYCTVGAIAGAAGCLGDDDDDTDETASEEDIAAMFELAESGSGPYAPWLAPEAVHSTDQESNTLFAYQSFEKAAEEGWEELLDVRQSEAQAFGTDEESLHGELFVGAPGEEEFTSIYLGEFDADSIVSHLESEGGAATGEYEGYTVVEEQVVVGDDAILVTPEYEAFIDAKRGTGPRLRDENEGVGLLLELQADGLQVSATQRSDISDLQLSGSSFVSIDGGSPERVVRTFVFESEEDASVERAEDIAESGDYSETIAGERHGRVVMLEYET